MNHPANPESSRTAHAVGIHRDSHSPKKAAWFKEPEIPQSRACFPLLALFILLFAHTGQAQPLTILDQLILYTPEAATSMGSTTALNAAVLEAVADTNRAFQNSEINVRTRLVAFAPVAEPEIGSTSGDLNRLKAPDDGFYDIAHTLRDAVGADLVTLIIDAPSSSGVGRGNQFSSFSQPSDQIAYTAILRRSLVGTFTLAHELGHNLGANHTVFDQGSPGRFPYSNGWRFTTEGRTYRTIMARQFGARIPYFSNPEVLFKGTPTGSPADSEDPADNAATINSLAPDIGNFRAEQVSNDAYANAQMMEGFWTSGMGHNLNSSSEAGEPQHAGQAPAHSIWWKWVSPVTETVRITTSGTTFPHRIAIYQGSSLDTLEPLAATRSDAGLPDLELNVVQGQTLSFAIDSLSDEVGFAALQIQKNNDLFADRIKLSGNHQLGIALTENATSEIREPEHGNADSFFGASRSVWWEWQPTASGTATISSRGTTYTTVMGVYQGTNVRELTLVAEESFDGSNGLFRTVSFEAVANERYQIAIDSPGGLGSNSGMAVLHIDLEPTEGVQFTSILRNPDGTITLNIDGFLNHDFNLERSTNLQDWSVLETHEASSLPLSIKLEKSDLAQLFFRLATP